MTLRRVELFVDMLPPESATKTAIRDALTPEQMAEVVAENKDLRRGHGPWSHTDMRLMALHDVLSWILYALYAVNGAKPSTPDPYPRPGIAPPQTRLALTSVAFERLEGMREADRAERVRAGTERPGRAAITAEAAKAFQEKIRQARGQQDSTTGG